MDVLPPPPNDATTRMGPLAKLPVFWALEGKRVVVAGGTDAAAWKAELLSACGAQVHVYAETLSECFASLVGAEALNSLPASTPTGRYVHHPRRWSPADFAAAAMAIADCEDDDDARTFFEAGCWAGVPVNVIDKPAFCQFQFGSIVNRSPVVVAISTDGAAPILAQSIRRKIETLLPPALKSWAALAQSLRQQINRQLAPGEQRRLFWERFVDRAFAGTEAPGQGIDRDLLADAAKIATGRAAGSVTVVGVGPGDAELLTLKAVRALQAADVIVFDTRVSAEVLELARREARRMMVGTTGDPGSGRQDDVGDLMVKLATAGKRVVRLRSGDAAADSRAGDEADQLRRAGIPVDVVPGVTVSTVAACGRAASPGPPEGGSLLESGEGTGPDHPDGFPIDPAMVAPHVDDGGRLGRRGRVPRTKERRCARPDITASPALGERSRDPCRFPAAATMISSDPY